MPPPKLPLMQIMVNKSSLIAEKMGFVCFLHLGCCGPPCGRSRMQPHAAASNLAGTAESLPPPPRQTTPAYHASSDQRQIRFGVELKAGARGGFGPFN